MIVVTGATGFVGSVLVNKLLALGRPVRALKREKSVIPDLLKSKLVNWVNADIMDSFALEDAFDGAEQVYHCAALVSFNPADKKKMFEANIRGTANVVNACLEKNVLKLLHLSSVAAIGETKTRQLISEDDHWEYQPRQSGYAISKYESEMEVWRGIAEGLKAVIVNPSVIIGKEAGTAGSGQIFERVRKGLNYYTSGSCGLVDVDDVTESMIALMDGNYASQRYIISAENWTYRDLFAEIAQQFGLNPPPREALPWMLAAASAGTELASAFTGKKNTLIKETVLSAFKKQSYTNQKIKKAINIEFKPVSQSIKRICDAFEPQNYL